MDQTGQCYGFGLAQEHIKGKRSLCVMHRDRNMHRSQPLLNRSIPVMHGNACGVQEESSQQTSNKVVRYRSHPVEQSIPRLKQTLCILQQYSKRSAPCDGSAVVITAAYAEEATNQSCMDVICLRVWGHLQNTSYQSLSGSRTELAYRSRFSTSLRQSHAASIRGIKRLYSYDGQPRL